MTRLPDADRVQLIVWWEVRRRLRALRGRTSQLIALGISGLFLVPVVIGLGVGAFFVGQSGDTDLVTAAADVVPPGVWLAVSAFAAVRVITDGADPDNRDGYLTTVAARDLFAGVAAVELLGTLAYLTPPAVVAGVGYALGTGTSTVAATVALAVLVPGVLGVATGQTVGYAVANVSVRSRLIQRLRVPIWAVVFVAYVWTFLSGEVESVFDPLLATVARPPLTWLGEFALAPVVGTDPVRGGVALVGSLALAVGLFAVTGVLARLLWYADGVASDPAAHGDGETSVDAGLAGRLVGRRAAWIARVSTVRAVRAPVKLLFVAYPVFLLAPSVSTAVETGRIPASLPPTAALYAAWAGGAGFALNPLGDQGATLPVTATSGVPGWAFVRGVVLPGVVLGGGVGTALAGGLSLVAGDSLPRVLLLAGAAVVVGVAAPALAAGVGTLLPKFEASRVTRSREAVVPSLFAFAGYSLALVLLAGPGVALAVEPVADAVAGFVGTSALVVSAVGVGGSALLLGVAGVLAAAYAARSFERFTVD